MQIQNEKKCKCLSLYLWILNAVSFFLFMHFMQHLIQNEDSIIPKGKTIVFNLMQIFPHNNLIICCLRLVNDKTSKGMQSIKPRIIFKDTMKTWSRNIQLPIQVLLWRSWHSCSKDRNHLWINLKIYLCKHTMNLELEIT